MLDFKIVLNEKTKEPVIETSLFGKPLLTTPQLNKSTAFTLQERIDFNLLGKLPLAIETLDEQVKRVYQQFHNHHGNLQKHIYLYNLHDKNQVLFYKLLEEHLEELMPVIYTPIVGNAVKEFNTEFRQPRGLYIDYLHRDKIETILDNRSNPDIDLIVITDGEGILGIGDQGVGGIDIPIAKLMVYTACGGISPFNTLPIILDVGTNNEALLDNPLYLGLRKKRITGSEYDDFIESCIAAIKKKFPNVFLHWEDFGRDNAHRYINKYKDQICTFNDDMQGTGVVTVAAINAAILATKGDLTSQRIVVFGAGTAGTGISEQILDALVASGLSKEEAYERFWLIDKAGVLVDDMTHMNDAQRPFARSRAEVAKWEVTNEEYLDLLTVVNNVKPTIMIGCSAVSGAFNEEIIKAMASHVAQPIILPLSNPTDNAEATPSDLLEWTQGRALIATGSPFEPVSYAGKTCVIPQCNNALVFPGLGLGLIAVKATRLTDTILWAACDALSRCSPVLDSLDAPLLPAMTEAKTVAKQIAVAVAKQVFAEGLATVEQPTDLEEFIEAKMWEPQYLPLKRKKA